MELMSVVNQDDGHQSVTSEMELRTWTNNEWYDDLKHALLGVDKCSYEMFISYFRLGKSSRVDGSQVCSNTCDPKIKWKACGKINVFIIFILSSMHYQIWKGTNMDINTY
jgi:hypothetical protein